jgi:penicillin-binding protein 2
MAVFKHTFRRKRQSLRVKDHLFETRQFTRRTSVAMFMVFLALLLLVSRLAYLQVINHQHFITLSENNRVRLQPLPPTRGLIYDRNGVLLAENLPSHRLEIIPEQVDDLDATLLQLREMIDIDETDVERFRKLRERNAPYNGIPLRFRLNESELNRLAVDLYRLPGVNIRADLTRHYPAGENGVHIIGYVGRINERELQQIDTSEYSGTNHIGKTGVEKYYEPLLHGRVGYQQVETNAQGRVLRVLQQNPPAPGKNIYLTIDIEFQKLVEQALGDYTGAIVAIDPRNGEVLALASMPGYDPNPFVNGIDVKSYQALSTSPRRPLYNRALLGTYPPGSTIKPFIGLAGLEYSVTDRKRDYYCPGFFRIQGHERKFRDWRRGGHGHVHLDKAIIQSCDVYFYQLALDLGIDRIHEYLQQFSLGQPTGIDLSGEKSGLLPSQQWKRLTQDVPWYAGDTLIAGIGQGFMLTTPVQLAHATATLAMDGRPYQPRLLYAYQDQGEQDIIRTPRDRGTASTCRWC